MAGDLDITDAADAAAADPEMQGAAGNAVQVCPAVTLEIGVFFDGTGNNIANVNSGDGFGASFGNGLSNVALLYPLYKAGERYTQPNACGTAGRKFGSIYKQGIGTQAGESDYWPDNLTGAGTGTGPTGVEARVYEACLDVGRLINRLSPGVEPAEIIMDVFGFSRGAAAARYFVNCFRQGFVEYYQYYVNLQRASLPPGRNVTFRFVGIFDTVAAIGLGTNDDNGPVNVHCSTAQADQIYHLTAQHEYRKNFRLNKNTPGGGDTREMLGAHSDVGGGYADKGDKAVVVKSQDHIFTSRRAAETAHAAAVAQAAAERSSQANKWISEGWINANDVEGGFENTPTPIVTRVASGVFGVGPITYSFQTKTVLNRTWVSPGLNTIPLRIMYDKAVAKSVPFLSFPADQDNYKIPDKLARLAGTLPLDGPLPPPANIRQILRDFGHISASFGSFVKAPETNFDRITYDNIKSKAK